MFIENIPLSAPTFFFSPAFLHQKADNDGGQPVVVRLGNG